MVHILLHFDGKDSSNLDFKTDPTVLVTGSITLMLKTRLSNEDVSESPRLVSGGIADENRAISRRLQPLSVEQRGTAVFLIIGGVFATGGCFTAASV